MKKQFKVAVVTTAYYQVSHADVIVSRWLEPRPADSEWGWPALGPQPQSQIASLYITPATPKQPDDKHWEIGREIAQRHGVPVYETIREALTLGGETLAVDGVLLIGEHGDFPTNPRGQKLYPRYEFWKDMVQVMREAGRIIPVFLDKHLSYDNARALEIYEEAQALAIPLLAGSSLPYCKTEPDLNLPAGCEIAQVVTLFYGDVEPYGFHILEFAQSLIEARCGGESGIRRVRALVGADAWQLLLDEPSTQELFQLGLSVAKRVTAGEVGENCCLAAERTGQHSPVALCVEHCDGLRATHFLLEGHIQDFIVAICDKDNQPQAARVAMGDASNFYAHFATLNGKIEEMFLHGRQAAPLERTLLATLTINTLLEALEHPGLWHDTPHLLRPYEYSGATAPPHRKDSAELLDVNHNAHN